MIQYLVKNQVDRIQCNDTGKLIYETLAYLYKGKPTPLKYSDVLHRAGCSEDGLKFWLKQLSNWIEDIESDVRYVGDGLIELAQRLGATITEE